MRIKFKFITAVLTGLIIVGWVGCGVTNSQVETDKGYELFSPFAVSYEKIEPDQAAGYDLVILEPDHYNKSEIDAIKQTGAKVLAYLSVGEVGKFRWYFSQLQEHGFLGMNENWGSYYINLANSASFNLFFNEIIPEIMIRDFDGLFLDTVDAVAPYTDRNHLQPYVLKFIRQIHEKYPEAMIVQNAGLFLLGETAPVIDAVLIEDVATHYNFSDNSYGLKEYDSYKDKVQRIHELSTTHDIPFLIVDFATKDGLRNKAKQRLDSLAYPYFINNIGLNNISTGITGNNY